MLWIKRAALFIWGYIFGFTTMVVLVLIYSNIEPEPAVTELPIIVAQTENTAVPFATMAPTAAALIIVAPSPTPTPVTASTPLPTPTSLPTWTPIAPSAQAISAADVIHAFRSAGLPIGDVVEFTAETDSNSLLGRPNQYIQKVNWKDTRVEEQGEPGVSTGGTVEVFLTVGDLEARKAYVETISASASFLAQYSFANGLVLIRLSRDLTPDEAKGYENVLMGLTVPN